MLSRVSIDEVFMHYFQKMSSVSESPLGDFHPSPPNLPTPLEKILWTPMLPAASGTSLYTGLNVGERTRSIIKCKKNVRVLVV